MTLYRGGCGEEAITSHAAQLKQVLKLVENVMILLQFVSEKKKVLVTR